MAAYTRHKRWRHRAAYTASCQTCMTRGLRRLDYKSGRLNYEGCRSNYNRAGGGSYERGRWNHYERGRSSYEQGNYNPGEDIGVEEQLVGSIPSMADKFGMKLRMRCDIATSYTWGMLPGYLGTPSAEAPPAGAAAGNGIDAGAHGGLEHFFMS
ncbi:uncharacterized protein V6R79_007776 [Siganus canaliculatus]